MAITNEENAPWKMSRSAVIILKNNVPKTTQYKALLDRLPVPQWIGISSLIARTCKRRKVSRGCWKSSVRKSQKCSAFCIFFAPSALFHPPVATDAPNLDENQEVLVITSKLLARLEPWRKVSVPVCCVMLIVLILCRLLHWQGYKTHPAASRCRCGRHPHF